MNIKRHGDITLHPSVDEQGEVINHTGKYVLAEGETTGHKHVISVPKIEDMVIKKLADGSILLTLKADGQITHEEHTTIKIPKGIYKMNNEREYNYFALSTQRVID